MSKFRTNHKRAWTIAEEEFIRRNAGKMKDEEIAAVLKRNTKAIREKRQKMNIKKQGGRGVVALKGQYKKDE